MGTVTELKCWNVLRFAADPAGRAVLERPGLRELAEIRTGHAGAANPAGHR